MTIRRLGITLVVSTLGYGCAEAVSLDDKGPGTGTETGTGGTSTNNGGRSSNGGSTGEAEAGATSSAQGGTGTSSTPAKGGTTATTTASGGTPPTTTTTPPTPTSCGTATGELTITHKPQEGGSGVTGNTTITPGTATSFKADAVKLKYCFYTIGDVPPALSTTTDAMKIYNADIGGMPAYTSLTSTSISTETIGTSQFCFIFDFGSVAAAAGIEVTGDGKINCNWSFDTSKVAGLSMDTREGKDPTLIVLYNDAIAACEAL